MLDEADAPSMVDVSLRAADRRNARLRRWRTTLEEQAAARGRRALAQLRLGSYHAGTFDLHAPRKEGPGQPGPPGPDGTRERGAPRCVCPGPKAWIDVFRTSIPSFRRRCEADASVPEPHRHSAAELFAQRYAAVLDLLERDPRAADVDAGLSLDLRKGSHLGAEARRGAGGAPGVDCLRLCALRDACMRQVGFFDPFREVKRKENAAALRLLPALLADVDAEDDAVRRMALAFRGVLAGNVFDLGAQASAELYAGGGAAAAFRSTRDRLASRPWAVSAPPDRSAGPEGTEG